MEGVSRTTMGAIRDVAMASRRAKIGGLLLRPALLRLREELDPEGAGGAYLLGLRKLGVIPHGRFTRYGFSQAILLAARGVNGDVVGRTHAALEAAGALKAPAPLTRAVPQGSERAVTVGGQT
jgi:glycerol-3-phosphate acyltransferase PlsX